MQNFKVGDWVRIKTGTFEYDGTASISKGVKQLSKSDMWIFSENHYKCAPDKYIEHWKPKPGEWCWFWNYDKQPEFGKATGITPLTENSDFYMGNTTYPYTREHLNQGFVYCEPFLGKLPSFLKGTK